MSSGAKIAANLNTEVDAGTGSMAPVMKHENMARAIDTPAPLDVGGVNLRLHVEAQIACGISGQYSGRIDFLGGIDTLDPRLGFRVVARRNQPAVFISIKVSHACYYHRGTP